MMADRGEAEAQRFGDGAECVEVGSEFGFGFVDSLDRGTGEFELACGFEGDGGGTVGALALEADRVAAVENGVPGPGFGKAIEDGADATGFVGGRSGGGLEKAELLVLRADAVLGGRLAAGGDVRRELLHRGGTGAVGVSRI